MIINRRFIFPLVLLWLATPMHTQAPSYTNSDDIMAMTEMQLTERISYDCWDYPRSEVCKALVRRRKELMPDRAAPRKAKIKFGDEFRY
jgi:hypothetical protein